MREILFRGKRKDNDNPWIYGHLHKMDGYGTGYTEYGIQVQDTSTSRPWSALVIPETVGQYTGLTDKNGKKIFEGDIVEGADFTVEDGGYGVVSFDDGAFEVGGNNIIGTFHENYWGKEFEIIGNIHDNPELLGGE